MGNKFSLTISLDHCFNGDEPIVAGSQLKGQVILRVHRKIVPDSLSLRLMGAENTIVGRAPRASMQHEHALLQEYTKLREGGGSSLIKRGTYTIPFTFNLPSSLPSSTQYPYHRGKDYNCRIQYSLIAKLGSYTMTKIFSVAAIPLPREVVPCLVQPTTQEIRTFGVISNGYLSMGASVDTAHIGRGQTLRVSIASRNDTDVTIERASMKLVELIQYHAYGEKRQSKVILFDEKDVNLPSLFKEPRKSRSEVKQDKRRGGLGNSMEATYQAIYEDLVSRQNQFEFVIPEWARDSYRGKLLTVSHYLKITFITKALTDHPSTKIPIVIGSPPLSSSQQNQQHQEPEIPVMHIATPIGHDCSTWNSDMGVSPTVRVPMVNAVMLDPNDNVVPNVQPSAPDETIILESNNVFLDHDNGSLMGDPYYAHNEGAGGIRVETINDEDETAPEMGGYRQAATSAVRPSHRGPSIGQLLQELDDDINDLQVFLVKERQPEWVTRFEELTINEYGAILSHVVMDYQIRVARLLANHISRSGFTCAYCVAAIQNTSEHFRSNMVEALLPLVDDLDQNYLLLRNALTEWEQVLTHRIIEDAIR